MGKLNGCVSFYDNNNGQSNNQANSNSGGASSSLITGEDVNGFLNDTKKAVTNPKNKSWLIWAAIGITLLVARGK